MNDQEIKDLQKIIDLGLENKKLKKDIHRLQRSEFFLKQENEKLKKALEFYANKDNWFGGLDEEYGAIDDCDWERIYNEEFKVNQMVGGKMARQLLNK